MKKLTAERFEHARDFVKSQARPLEKAIFTLEFEGGSVSNVLAQLAKFQNSDGGFGQALEPDVRTPLSSSLCTELGLRYLAEWHTPAEHPMVKIAVKYLLDSFDADTQAWRVIPEDANAYPHAPWWHDEAGSLARTFNDFLITPRAGVLAALSHYAELVPADWLAAVIRQTVLDIESMNADKFGSGGDALVYAFRLAQAQGLASTYKSRLVPLLRGIADRVVTRDPEAWSSYSAPPLKLASTPDALVADLLAKDVQNHLDYLIDQQTTDGCWRPTWSWGDFYPEYWPQAEQEWCGILTLDTLLSFRVFNRVSR